MLISVSSNSLKIEAAQLVYRRDSGKADPAMSALLRLHSLCIDVPTVGHINARQLMRLDLPYHCDVNT